MRIKVSEWVGENAMAQENGVSIQASPPPKLWRALAGALAGALGEIMKIEFIPDHQLEEAVQRSMTCAPTVCEREVHCGRMALALRDCFLQAYAQGKNCAPLPPLPPPSNAGTSLFSIGDYVQKRVTKNGVYWRGVIVGWYLSTNGEEGYVVESMFEPGSKHIYPASALEPWTPNHSSKADQAE